MASLRIDSDTRRALRDAQRILTENRSAIEL